MVSESILDRISGVERLPGHIPAPHERDRAHGAEYPGRCQGQEAAGAGDEST